MITDRDENMLHWLCEFRLATTNQINELFYKNINICNKRLLKLCKDKVISRTKDPYSKQYIYYTKKPKSFVQLKHYYMRNDFYINLIRIGCKIERYSVEQQMGSIIPDLCISFYYNDLRYMFFVEIERSERKIDVQKYNRFFIEEYSNYITKRIPVIYVTHKKVPKCNYETLVVNEKISNILDIFTTH